MFASLFVGLAIGSAPPALAAPAAIDTIFTASPTDTTRAATPTAGAGPVRKPAAVARLETPPHIHPRDANGRITDYTVAPGVTWHYENTKAFSWAYHIPRDLGQFPKFAFQSKNKETLLGIAAGSVALWAFDQVILDGAQHFGRFAGLKAASTQKTLVYIPFRIGSANLPFEFNVPDNLNST
ncbi:MAG: hypothetical protein M3Y12_15400, partial [Bacteroidota bacterium]|nr:hypothetical protein [Bacteroidota bacterium]